MTPKLFPTPTEKTLLRALLDDSLARAEKSCQAGRLDEAVSYLDRAGRISRKGNGRRQSIA